MIKYIERILIGTALKKLIQVLSECKEKGLYGYQWSLGLEKVVYM